MTDQPKPDLELATTDELWTELASRYETCVVLWSNPAKSGKDTSFFGTLHKGEDLRRRGLLAFAAEEMDCLFRNDLAAFHRRQAEENEEDP
jgi:hypothetical protein